MKSCKMHSFMYSYFCLKRINSTSCSRSKQVRKLLLLLCGTRERYRQLRDVHALDAHLHAARELLAAPHPAYDQLVQLMDHLKVPPPTTSWCMINQQIILCRCNDELPAFGLPNCYRHFLDYLHSCTDNHTNPRKRSNK